MLTKDNIKGCKKCNGKGHAKDKEGRFVACDLCCSHSGNPVFDPRDSEKMTCAQLCGTQMVQDKKKNWVPKK